MALAAASGGAQNSKPPVLIVNVKPVVPAETQIKDRDKDVIDV